PSRILVNKSFAETFAKELVDACFFKTSKTAYLNANDRLSLVLLSKSLPDKTAMEASKWLAIIRHPLVAVVLGKKGSGKSGLSYRLCEHLRWTAPIYAVGIPSNAVKYLPDWISVVPNIEDLPNGCIALVDESYILFHARSSMTARAKVMSQMINLSRQRGQTLIFVTQESGQIDRNILSSADVVIFKEPGILQPRFDRSELRAIAAEASQAFQSIVGNRKKWSYVFTQEKGFIGLIENSLPTFWSNNLSNAFAYVGECKVRLARKMN
ncbi:unnamed protein product, partial [marine sediment metagenome]